jgi:hypothetical protein
VEKYFEIALAHKIQVEFLGDTEWYLGAKFDWHHSSDDSVHCHISQEGYAATIVEEMDSSNANKSPLMSPYRLGFLIDTIPEISMSDAE